MSTNFYISVSVLTKYNLATDADELAFTFKTIEKSTRKKRYVIQKLLKKENPLFTLHVIIRNEVVWISLQLSPILPVSDFSYRVVFECLSPGTVLFTSCRISSSFWSKLKVKAVFLFYMACSVIEPNSAPGLATEGARWRYPARRSRLCAVSRT